MNTIIDISTLIALIALVISILSHRRSRTLNNENHIFEMKLKSYQSIINEMAGLSNKLQSAYVSISDIPPMRKEERENVVDAIVKSMENEIYGFITNISGSVVVIPANVYSTIEKFIFNLIGSENFTNLIVDGEEKGLDQIIEKMNALISETIELMRKDLNFENLHVSLFKRTEKRWL